MYVNLAFWCVVDYIGAVQDQNTPKCCLDLLRTTLTYVTKLLAENGVTYWAMKGSLLGAIREKDIIPHDYDIDLAMLMVDLNKVHTCVLCIT